MGQLEAGNAALIVAAQQVMSNFEAMRRQLARAMLCVLLAKGTGRSTMPNRIWGAFGRGACKACLFAVHSGGVTANY